MSTTTLDHSRNLSLGHFHVPIISKRIFLQAVSEAAHGIASVKGGVAGLGLFA